MIMQKNVQTKRVIEKYILVCLEAKTKELRLTIPRITLEQVYEYFQSQLEAKNYLIRNVNDAVYYIMNITEQEMIKFLDLDLYLKTQRNF